MNMKRIFAAIIILSALIGVSHADIVYTTSEGSLGVIPVTSIVSIDRPALRYSGLGEDILVGSYTVGSNPYVMVVDRASENAAGDTALVFKASDLTSPTERVTLNGVYNTKTFASSYNGRSIFFASQENASIVEFDTSSIDIPINVYTYTNTSEDEEYEPELIDISIGTSQIFALFRAAPDEVELFLFDGQLKEGVKNTNRGIIRNDATGLASLASNRAAIAAEEGISIANNTTIYTLVSTDYPVKSICRDSGNGLYYVEQSEAGDVNLYHYYNDNYRITKIDSMQGTSDCKLVRDSDYNILAAMIGDSIYLYSMTDDELLASFDSSRLGGIPLNITVSHAEYDNGSSSNSNCSVSGLGGMMMSVFVFGVLRRKR